jgi:hypothetical protein
MVAVVLIPRRCAVSITPSQSPVERLLGGEARDPLDVLHLRRGEPVDPDRVRGLDPAEELLVVLDPEVRVKAALQQDLASAERDRLLDLRRELGLGEDVALARGQVAVERAERALRGAHVRVVDVAVDDVGDGGLGVKAPAHAVREQAELEEVRIPQEEDSLLAGKPLSPLHLLPYCFKPGHGSAAPGFAG